VSYSYSARGSAQQGRSSIKMVVHIPCHVHVLVLCGVHGVRSHNKRCINVKVAADLVVTFTN